MKAYICLILSLMVLVQSESDPGETQGFSGGNNEKRAEEIRNLVDRMKSVLNTDISRTGSRSSNSPPVPMLQVDGKWFYVNFQEKERMTWKEAKAYCLEFGLQLASINTENQRTQIIEKLLELPSESTFFTYYWTSARESRVLDMMHWDESGPGALQKPSPGAPTNTQDPGQWYYSPLAGTVPLENVVVQWKFHTLDDEHPYKFCGVLGVWDNLHQFLSENCTEAHRTLCQYATV